MKKVKQHLGQSTLYRLALLTSFCFSIISCGSSSGISTNENVAANSGLMVDNLRLSYGKDKTVADQVGMGVSKNGELIALSYDDGTIEIVDVSTGRARKVTKIDNKNINEISFSYDNTKLVLSELGKKLFSGRKIFIVDIKTGREVKKFDFNRFASVAVSNTGNKIAIGVMNDSKLSIYDLDANKRINEFEYDVKGIPRVVYHPAKNEIAFLGSSGFSRKSDMFVIDPQTGDLLNRVDLDLPLIYDLEYSDNGDKVFFSYKKIAKSIVKYHDFRSNRTSILHAHKDRGSTRTYNSILSYNDLLLTATSEGAFEVFNITSGQLLYSTQKENFSLLGVDNLANTIFPLGSNGHFLINYSNNNINQIYDAKNNIIEGYIYSGANDDFAIVARDGRMEGGAEAISNVYWSEHKSDKRIPLEATFDQFYTPNLLQGLLSGDSGSQNVASLEKAIELSPLVKITRPDSVFSTDKDQLKLTVSGMPQGDPIKEFKVFVNGKPLGGDQRGLKLSGNSKTFTVPLLPGRSIISAVAVSEGGYQSAPDRIIANYQGLTDEANLHILAVGIDSYKNSSYNLNYATADASALIEEVQNKAGDIFREVKVTYIRDREATKENIQQAVQTIQSQVRLQDVFLFYYAGHGVMSEGTATIPSDFYLALYDVTSLYGNDNMLKEKGVSAAELKDIFGSITAQKQLIVLDACQSGGAVETFAMRGAAEEKAMIQLARSSGVVLLASTGSEQFATEFDQLGHGVFTYAILKGLDGKADSGDRKVTVKELEAYLNDTVPELTEQYKGTAQYPRSWSRGMDFPIGVIK